MTEKTKQRVTALPTVPGAGKTTPAKPRSSGLQKRNHLPNLKLDFRKAHLETVLNFFKDSVGVIIHVGPNVRVEHKLDLHRDELVNRAEAVEMLKGALTEKGCTLIRKGALLNIIRHQDAKKHWVALPAVQRETVPKKTQLSQQGFAR
jgi:hypothetical protein